jgi:hypothetical protein
MDEMATCVSSRAAWPVRQVNDVPDVQQCVAGNVCARQPHLNAGGIGSVLLLPFISLHAGSH